MRHRHGWEIVGSPPFLGRKLRQDAPSSPESSHFWRGMPSVNPAVRERPQSAFLKPRKRVSTPPRRRASLPAPLRHRCGGDRQLSAERGRSFGCQDTVGDDPLETFAPDIWLKFCLPKFLTRVCHQKLNSVYRRQIGRVPSRPHCSGMPALRRPAK